MERVLAAGAGLTPKQRLRQSCLANHCLQGPRGNLLAQDMERHVDVADLPANIATVATMTCWAGLAVRSEPVIINYFKESAVGTN